MIEVPVSWGELIDKITILQIKAERITDEAKRTNVERELSLLNERLKPVAGHQGVIAISRDLLAVNTALWEIEDDIRDCERDGDFGPRFVSLARSVYVTNDRRAELKRQINIELGSDIIEEKSYKPYAAA
ncbi:MULTISPECIES: DUF6165 family protein [Rhizobium/Agrobacterium group]|uniref:DUF6165 family protein n=1 Tax=Rhizobium/Agrobacterium group TaxID=227290 RepID=UPI000B4035C7|nr:MULTISPECIES: DUF6165 family protein [Rhizobium/Agrobacterium group]MCF1463030.1 hypothetical protein [Allorhizobium ampelinum]MCF1482452.1 hypothetical protein [Allorhizobium ampelinum]NSZ17896.1 hypothetical protein [Agrobacterium vitis]NSZ43907.1 hypothetical protein [Agrobacterium vitis]NTA27655.1 hypothetical protein [Allorhizobium ampelinum]